ncbi:MAG: hypothetical protein ABI651_05125, partial [Verrucomicrobiota bacterium]
MSAITIARRYHQEIVAAAPASSGTPAASATTITTDKVEMYTLTQSIAISSTNMNKVPGVSRTVISLIYGGHENQSETP